MKRTLLMALVVMALPVVLSAANIVDCTNDTLLVATPATASEAANKFYVDTLSLNTNSSAAMFATNWIARTGDVIVATVVANSNAWNSGMTNGGSGYSFGVVDATASNHPVTLAQLNNSLSTYRIWNLWPTNISPITNAYQLLTIADAGLPPTNVYSVAIASNGQYTGFLSPAMGLTMWSAGTYEFDITMWVTGNGGPTINESTEIYIRQNNGTEIELTSVSGTSPQTIGTTPLEYLYTLHLTTATALNLTDSLLVKLKSSGRAGNPTLNISLGVFKVPIPSSQFQLVSGMTNYFSVTGGVISGSVDLQTNAINNVGSINQVVYTGTTNRFYGRLQIGQTNTVTDTIFSIDNSTSQKPMLQITRASAGSGMRILNYTSTSGIQGFQWDSTFNNGVEGLTNWTQFMHMKISPPIGLAIGTNNPLATLDVNGTFLVRNTSIFSNTVNAVSNLSVLGWSSFGGTISSGLVHLAVSPSSANATNGNAIWLDSAGNSRIFGQNTTTMYVYLGGASRYLANANYMGQVNGGGGVMYDTPSDTVPSLCPKALSGNAGTGIGWITTNVMAFIAGSTNIMNVYDNGLVIGSTNRPTAALAVTGSVDVSGTVTAGTMSSTLATLGCGTISGIVTGTVTSAGIATNILQGGKLKFAAADMTLRFSNDQDWATIQTTINNAPTFGNGYTLALIFSNGVYTLTNTLTISGFHGYSQVYVTGINQTQTFHTNQAVVLDFSSANGLLRGLYVANNTAAKVILVDLNIKVAYTNNGYCTMFDTCSGVAQASGCKFTGTSTNNTQYGLAFSVCPFGLSVNCAYENFAYGFLASYSRCIVSGCSTGFPACVRGWASFSGSILTRVDINTISTLIENNYTGSGVIFTNNAVLP